MNPPASDRPDPRTADSLELQNLPRGQIHRLHIELMQDGLGAPVHLPVLVARGRKPGPVFGLTAAVHGNELNGIPLIQRLFGKLDVEKLKGTVVGVLAVNVPGLRERRRHLVEGRDLNHLMPGRADGNVGQVFAHRLIDRIINRFNFLIDLHTASFGRVNSLYIRANMDEEATARIAVLMRPQIILHNPASDRTLRGAAMDLGIPSITVEIGNPQRFHSDYIKKALTGVRAVMANVGMVAKRKLVLGAQPVLCQSSDWLYTDRGGLLEVFPKVTDQLEKGALIAQLRNAFGDVIREYHAPETGVVIGKSVNPVGYTGARILHLGIPSPVENAFTQKLTTQRLLLGDALVHSSQRLPRRDLEPDNRNADASGPPPSA